MRKTTPRDGDQGEGPHDPGGRVQIGLLQRADIEDADDPAVDVADGLIGRDVPVVDDKGPGEPGLSLVEDRFLDLRHEQRPDRPALPARS